MVLEEPRRNGLQNQIPRQILLYAEISKSKNILDSIKISNFQKLFPGLQLSVSLEELFHGLICDLTDSDYVQLGSFFLSRNITLI